MSRRALSFGAVAEAYERFRPGYPIELVDMVMAYAGRPTLGQTYGLVYAAAALHWTTADGRWLKVAALLEPGGVFASLGGPFQLADPAVADAVRAARAPFLDSDDVPSPDGSPPGQDMQWPGTELQRSEWFTDVEQLLIERRW